MIKPNLFPLRPLCALVCAGLLLAGCGNNNSLAAGHEYQQQGQYRSAYIVAKKLLQKNAGNSQALLLLGKSALMLGNPTEALTNLDKAKDAGLAQAQWVVPMGRALLATRQTDKLLKTLPAKPHFDALTNAKVLALRGDAQLGSHQLDAAADSYREALAQHPKLVTALVGQAYIALEREQADQAKGLVQQALAADADNPMAWSAKAALAMNERDYATAETAYGKALAGNQQLWLPQQRYAARSRLADAQVRQHHYDQALKSIKKLEQASASQPYPHYLHALVLYRQGHLDDAVRQLQKVLQVSANNLPAQLLLGAVNYAKGSYGQAEMYLSNVLGLDSDNRMARRLLALSYYRGGRSQQAINMLRPTVAEKTSDTQLLALLQKASSDGAGLPKALRQDESVTHMLAQATSSAGAISGPFADARRAIARGDNTAAIQRLQTQAHAEGKQDLTRTSLLATAYIRSGQLDRANALAAAYAKAHPEDDGARMLYGSTLVAAHQLPAARKEFAAALKLAPTNVHAMLSLGNVDVLEHDYAAAAKQYQAVLKAPEGHARAYVALGHLALLQKHEAEAIKQFRLAMATAPTQSAAYVALISVYTRSGQFDAATEVAAKLATIQPHSAAALNALGAAQINAKHPDKALKPLRQAVQLAPDTALFQINLARAELLSKDPDGAKGTLGTLLKKQPTNVQAVALLASIAVQEGHLSDAIQLAQTLQQQPGRQRAGLALEGDLYLRGKDYRKAAHAYGQAIAAGKPNRALEIKRFLALRDAGVKQPEANLLDWLKQHQDDDALRMLLGQYYLGLADHTAAADQYQSVLKRFPNNVVALNNLAWIYIQQGNPKAVDVAAHAHKLAPNSASIQDTYGLALLKAKQPKSALPVLAAAAKASPETAVFQYHLALAQAGSGDVPAALATLEALIQPDHAFAQRAQAEALYQSLRAKAGQ